MDSLDTSLGTYVGVAKMTRGEAAVAAAIARNGRANRAAIWHALYGGMGDDEQREPKIIDVFVCKLRKKLGPVGITIETIWGSGYSMSAESIGRLNELAAEQTPRMDSPSLVPSMVA